MKREELPSIKNTIIGLFICLCALIVIFASGQVGAVVNPTADNITLDVQCANGRMGKGKCPAGQEFTAPTTLPRATISNFSYVGAFRVPASEASYSPAIIGQSITAGNFYMTNSQPIGGKPIVSEYSMPALSMSNNIAELNDAPLVQSTLDLSTAPNGNAEPLDVVGGLYPFNGSVIATVAELYDASANNLYAIARINNPSNFANPQLGGYYRLQGAFKASGWISEVPTAWQSSVGASHIVGNASNWSIISRASVGPSMYAINLNSVIAATPAEPIPTTPLISYELTEGRQLQQQVNPAYDLNNSSGLNKVWNYTSHASFGFIVPNTRTYAVFGFMSGQNSGVGYNITTNQGNTPNGNAAYDETDWNHYVWFFDMNDIIDAKNGNRPLYSVAPYAYQEFQHPFSKAQGATTQLQQRGGMFDAANNRLYLSIADAYKPASSPKPVIVAYTIGGF